MGRLRQYCTVYGCRRKLISLWGSILGICDHHYNFIDNDDFWVGICWNCCTVTAMGPRETFYKKERSFIKDKYIFSKGCKECTDDEKMNISWMTINEGSESTTNVIYDENKKKIYFVPKNAHLSSQLKSGSPSIARIKSSQVGPTWDVKLDFDWNE